MDEKSDKIKNIRQEQVHNLLFSREIGWQEIIYDLINTEQLDPWDVNIAVLTERYLEKIRELEEMDFFVSSKVLLAAAFLLRIKSEMLLTRDLKSIDEILFGKKEEKKHVMERIELDEEIPDLIPRTPMPRFRKVTLKELVEALNKAITTENRRIKKEIINKNALRETGISLPKRRFSLKDKIEEIMSKILDYFKTNKNHQKIHFNDLSGNEKEDRISSFSSLLHLENQQKIWMDQEDHFKDIHVWMKEVYVKEKGDPFLELKKQLEEDSKEKIKKRKSKEEK